MSKKFIGKKLLSICLTAAILMSTSVTGFADQVTDTDVTVRIEEIGSFIELEDASDTIEVEEEFISHESSFSARWDEDDEDFDDEDGDFDDEDEDFDDEDGDPDDEDGDSDDEDGDSDDEDGDSDDEDGDFDDEDGDFDDEDEDFDDEDGDSDDEDGDSDDEDGGSDDEDGDDDENIDEDDDVEEEPEPSLVERVSILNVNTLIRAYQKPTYSATVGYGNVTILCEGWYCSKDGSTSYSVPAAYGINDTQFSKFTEGNYYAYKIRLMANGNDYFSTNTTVSINGKNVAFKMSNDKRMILIYDIFGSRAACYHEYKYQTIKATCTQDGYTLGTCKFCKQTLENKIVYATGHVVEKTAFGKSGGKYPSKKATCSEAGYDSYVCKNCKELIYQTPVAPSGHTYKLMPFEELDEDYEDDEDYVEDEGVEKTSLRATCTKDGYYCYVCSTCNSSYNKVIPMTGHKYSSKANLFEEDDYDEESFGDNEPIFSKRATCTKAGYYYYPCTNDFCCAGKKVTVKATGHKYTKLKISKVATGTANGTYYYACSNPNCSSKDKNLTIFSFAKIKLSCSSYTYDGNAKKPTVSVYDKAGNKISSDNYNAVIYDNKSAGTATVHVTFSKMYKGVLKTTFTIKKAAQTITADVASKSYKYSAISKAAASFSIGAKAKTKLSYKSGNTKYVTVSTAGKVTIKKGTPKGTYTVTVSAAEGTNYKAAAKTVTVKVS